MRKLSELIPCNYDTLISSVEDDSRIKNPNYLFCCIEGLTVDGHDYINDAIENGAVAILSKKEITASVPVVKVKDTNKAMIEVLSRFYDHPEDQMKLIGITGTDGKTTVASMLYQILNMVSKAGYIGTNGIECSEYSESTYLTTPLPKNIFRAFDIFNKNKCKYVAMEVSSERLLTNRIDDMNFDIGIFTNLTHDHFNNHKTFENYRDCKIKMFKKIKDNGYAIINTDDENASSFIKSTNGKIFTYGIECKSDFMAKDIIIAPKKLIFKLIIKEKEYMVESPLSGKYNVYNLLAVIATFYALGFDIKTIIEHIKELKTIKGRADVISFNNGFKVLIDYAHTANALKNILEYTHILTDNRIITVTGTAGGRDTTKRSELGNIATSLSDKVIFTMDDPRMEDPNDIIDQMVSKLDKNVHNYERIVDRASAIKRALKIALPGDVVVITGRGNDFFMPIGNKFIRCNDYEEVYKNMEKEVNENE